MQKKIKNSFISNSDVQRANIGNAAFCIYLPVGGCNYARSLIREDYLTDGKV